MIWVIEYLRRPACWIREARSSGQVDVTFDRKLAQRFLCQEDAKHEMLQLGLNSAWTAKEIGGGK